MSSHRSNRTSHENYLDGAFRSIPFRLLHLCAVASHAILDLHLFHSRWLLLSSHHQSPEDRIPTENCMRSTRNTLFHTIRGDTPDRPHGHVLPSPATCFIYFLSCLSPMETTPRPFSNSFISSSSIFSSSTTAVHFSLCNLNIINSQTYVIVMHEVDVARTHEILARYRPIAPKPPVSDAQIPPISPSGEKLNVARAPSRPGRTRKRGRGTCASSFASQKRTCRSTYVPVLPSPNLHRHHGLPLFRFSPATAAGANNKTTHPVKAVASSSSSAAPAAGGDHEEEFLTLSLFPYSYKQDNQDKQDHQEQEDASSTTTTITTIPSNPTEKDLLGRLHKCLSKTVIVPQPLRPVGSSVFIGSMKEEAVDELTTTTTKTPSEFEDDAELDELPVVVSDSHNRVRLANSAYKELVGQPECSWLETMMIVNGGGGSGAVGKRRRISGEVMLELSDGSTAFPLPVWCNRFSCKVKIEWTTCNGQKKLVSSPCDVTRLSCPSKDYAFSWRFRTHEST